MSNTKDAVAEKVEVVKDIKNGVTRPGPDTATGRVWAICDVLFASQTEDNPVTRARVIKNAEAEGINVSTAATQYGRYRKYHGLAKETAVAVKTTEPKAPKGRKAKTEAAVDAPVVEEAVVEATPEVATAAEPDYLAEGEAEGEAEV